MNEVTDAQTWRAARVELLRKEKEFTRLRDDLAQQRRDLPWERVDKTYDFHDADGTHTLDELFAGRSQLIVYHFMFPPSWDEGCPHCSFWADNFDGIPIHLNQRDITFVAVSRAPYEKLAHYRQRMGWSFDWLSSFGSDFNYDFGVSFTPEDLAAGTAVYNYTTVDPGIEDREGVSVFLRDVDEAVVHTYSAYARGIDMLNGATTTSISCPRAAMRPVTTIPSSGYAATTNTDQPADPIGIRRQNRQDHR